ncbi:MAG: nickel-dependent lactate racemase [Planctomycetota bacterium]
MSRPVALRYALGHATLRLPESAAVLRPPEAPALADPTAAVREALRSPIASASLREMAAAKRPHTVAISISDITRPVPNELLLTAILEELNAAGVPDAACFVVIATGMHRPSTPKERDLMLGHDLQRRVEVIDHEAKRPETVTRVSDDPPVSVHTRFLEADLKIVTGLIESHFMAGFSGGRKGVCPGLVDLETIQRFHGYAFMGDPNTVEGRLEHNPCHDEALRVARLVRPDFLVNVAITHDRKPAGVYAGDLEEAFLVGCRDVAEWTGAGVDEPFDLVVTCAGGFPLDQSFYQTSKGLVGALPALREDSTLLMLAACTEIGEPEYVSFFDRFGPDWRAFLDHIATSGITEKDQWALHMQTRLLRHIGVEKLMFANDGLSLEDQIRIGTTPCPGQGSAVQRAQRFIDRYLDEHPDARVAVIPEGPYTMLKRRGAVGVA